MTSSATTTKGGKAAGGFELPTLPIAVLAGINVAGWVLVLYVNHWRFTAPVVFLMLAWTSLMLIANYLWNAGVAAASPTDDHDGFNVVETRREELLREKRSLLKALKEIEFDQQLGKMSDEDASEVASVYRARAIEVIKLLELEDGSHASGADQDLGVRELIEREVKARRSLGVSSRKAARQLAGKKARKKAKGAAAAAKNKKTKRASAKPAPHAAGAVFDPDTEDLVNNSSSAREEEE